MVGMRIMAWQISSSSLERPELSRPNRTAAPAPAEPAICVAAVSGVTSGQAILLVRALVPNTSPQSATASSTLGNTAARARISSAPAALAVHSALGKCRGATSAS